MALAGSRQDAAARFGRRPAPRPRRGGGVVARRPASIERCAVTGIEHPADRLIRFVAGPPGARGRVPPTPDLDRRLPGPDVWVSADAAILRQAIDGGLFEAAFGAAIAVDVALAQRLERLLVARAQNDIGLARRAGAISAGFENCHALVETLAARPGRDADNAYPFVAVLASDAAAGSAEKFFRMLKRLANVIPMRCSRALSAVEIGQVFDRQRVVQLVVRPSGIAACIEADLYRLDGFRHGPSDNEPPINGRRIGSDK